MLLADYSSIEVRVLAEMSGDARLLEDAIYGDVHSRSASAIFKIDFDYFCEVLGSDDPKYDNIRPLFKSMRSRAKSFTFQLLYGAGAAALAIVLRCTDEEAFAAIEAWATTYPKAYHQRTIWHEMMMHSGFLPVKDGRTIFVFKQDRSLPVAANYPVQGTAASVMYRAVYHVHKRLYDSALPARLAASIHDELLTYARKSCAEEAAVLVREGMVQGWLDIFPDTNTDNLIGKGNVVTIGTNWGDKV
jgi:DNA polymerase-1